MAKLFVGDKRYLRMYDLKQKVQHHPEVGTYVSEEDIDFMERIIVDETHLRHGEWKAKEKIIKSPFAENYYCSVCKNGAIKCSRYCPECGARMDGGNK